MAPFFAAFVLCQASVPNFQPDSSYPGPELKLIGNYSPQEPWNCVGSSNPLCNETLATVLYPVGTGPAGLGYPASPLPVFVALRGGNSNDPNLGFSPAWLATVAAAGFIAIYPNFPVVDGQSGGSGSVIGGGPGTPPGQSTEDYQTPLAALAYLLQYLRAHKDWFNIQEQNVYVFGRSMGGYMTYGLALREDAQDLSSSDPVEHQSSRPDGVMSFSAPTAFECFAPSTSFGPTLEVLFPKATSPNATLQDKLDVSPWYWLKNPQLFNRSETPPMFLAYGLGFWQGGCGQITDPHSGAFGWWMDQHIKDFVNQTNDPDLGLNSILYDSNDFFGFGQGIPEALDWCKQVMSGPVYQSYLLVEGGDLVAKDAVAKWNTLGAAPGGTVYFFLGTQEGSLPIPGCGNLAGKITNFFLFGVGQASQEGIASASLYIPPGLSSISFLTQSLDLTNCSLSNLLPVYL